MLKHVSWLNKRLFKGNDKPSYKESSFPELYYFFVVGYLWYDSIQITYLDIKPSSGKWNDTVLFCHGVYSDLGK